MGRFIEALRHAFAVNSPAEKGFTLPDSLERLARAVVARKMETPALIALESVRPLSFLASQAVHAFAPIAALAAPAEDLREVALALENRSAVPELARRIEELAAEARR